MVPEAVGVSVFDDAEACALPRFRSDAVRGALDVLFRSDWGIAQTFAGLDVGTRAHLRRVCEVAARIAIRLDCNSGEIRAAAVGGLLHDVGKSLVTDAILRKETALEPSEWEIVRLHPLWGSHVARSLGDQGVSDAIGHHHERLDGSGYPYGLKAPRLGTVARVVAVADVYDALTSNRPYRAAYSSEEAFHRISEVAGTKLDRDAVDALLAVESHRRLRAA